MMAKYQKNSLSSRITEILMKHGELTIAQIIAKVGRHISTSKALSLGKKYLDTNSRLMKFNKKKGGFNRRANPDKERYTQDYIIQMGRYRSVLGILGSCVQSGRIRRVNRGTYGPPLPKIANFGEKAG